MTTGTRLVVLLLLVGTFCVEAEDVTCGPRSTSKKVKKVTIMDGDSFTFKTQTGAKYGGKVKCRVTYKRDDSCPAMRFSCDSFALSNTRENCKGGDKMAVVANGVKQKYCQNNSPNVTTTGKAMKVVFKSSKYIHDEGAVCRVECVADTSTTTTIPTPTEVSWPEEPLSPTNYTGQGEMVQLDSSMEAYLVRGDQGASKVIVWNFDSFGITGPLSNMRRTKVWADFLAETGGYTVIIPDWFKGTSMPSEGFGSPEVMEWFASVTNWTTMVEDWNQVIFPYIEDLSPGAHISLIGTCWGSYPVIRLSQFSNIVGGISMHPSHSGLASIFGESEEEFYNNVEGKQLFLVEGDAADSVKPEGLAEQVLGDKLEIVVFPDMAHGWTTGGNLSDPLVLRDYRLAQEMVIDFLDQIYE